MLFSLWRFIVRRHHFFAYTALCALLFLAGCAQNNVVRLASPGMNVSGAAAPKESRVCVVDFTNKRGTHAVGELLNGEALLPRTPVERWLAESVAAALTDAGYAVSTAETMAEALAGNAEYIVTGEAEEVWLAESSLARYTGAVRASIALLDNQGAHITRNNYSSVYSQTTLPVYGVPQDLLADALAEMLRPAIRLLVTMMP